MVDGTGEGADDGVARVMVAGAAWARMTGLARADDRGSKGVGDGGSMGVGDRGGMGMVDRTGKHGECDSDGDRGSVSVDDRVVSVTVMGAVGTVNGERQHCTVGQIGMKIG